MSVRTMSLVMILAISACASAVALGTRAQEPAKPGKPTAQGVIKLWSPELKSSTDFHQWHGSPKHSPEIAVVAFRVVGPTFAELWNHYAGLCGMKGRYEANSFQVITDAGPKGSYVILDRMSGDGKGARGPSVFLLKNEAYTVTVTFAPDPGGESISGSLSAVVP